MYGTELACCPLRGIGHRLHLVERRQALQRLDLDLPYAFPRQAEAAADLLERLRLGVVEPVAEDDHRTVAVGKGVERIRERLGAEGVLDLLVGERPLAGD